MYEIETDYEVAVIGGGVAGLSAALMLARARISVVVIDAPGGTSYDGETHNWLTNDGASKADLLERGRSEVIDYPDVRFIDAEVTAIEKDAFGYALSLSSQDNIEVKRLVLATGLVVDHRETGIEGFETRFGRDIFTCPYCHGYEFADRKIALLGTSEKSIDFLRLLSNWSDAIDYVSHDGPPAETVRPVLARIGNGRAHQGRGVRIEGPAAAPVCVLEDETRVAADVIFLADLPGRATPVLADVLGLEKGLHPQTGEVVFKTDATGRTPLGNVFLIGDARTGFSTLAGAANEGMVAGFMLSNDVIESRLKAAGIPAQASGRAA